MVAASWTTIHSKEAGPMAQAITVLGIDIAKLVFHVVGMDDAGHVVLRKRITRPTMRFVPIKQVEQQDLQALHRIRERLIKARTALVNEIRGLLSEYGIVLPQSITKFRALIVEKLEND